MGKLKDSFLFEYKYEIYNGVQGSWHFGDPFSIDDTREHSSN